MNIFRAYDIRGVYGKDLTCEIMTRIGKAAGTCCPGTFTVGRDFREHGEPLEEAFVQGLVRTGSNAELVGTCPASLCVFTNWKMRNDTTAYITASHLPAEWNGIKFFHQDGVGFFENENRELGEISSSGNFKTGNGLAKKLAGLDEEYANFVAERIKPERTNVVADFGNGAACLLVPKILKKIGVNASYLFDWPDPNFSNRDPEPKPESLTALREKVKKEKADLGIAFDGDGDRAMFVDDTGRVIMTEQAAILFIRDIMKTQRGPVVANVECSNIIDEEVKKYGETVFRIPVGHTFLVQETKKHNAVFGVEKSGHICVPKFFWFDDAIINSIYMTEIVSNLEDKLSKVVNQLPTRFFERIEIPCSDETKFKVVEKIREEAIQTYENVDTIDGAKIIFPDSWALIRASNTSPELRLSIEARDQKRITELKKEMMDLIDRIAPNAAKAIG
jgi:phosphomannomutase